MNSTAHHETIVASVESRIVAQNLLRSGDRLLLALSGGIDSMVLLDIFLRLRGKHAFKLYACHINHHLRGQESERDACFVAQRLKELGVPCEILTALVPPGVNVQQGARELRYQLFGQLLRQKHCDRLLLAHHADDQAELLLMRLASGCGLQGASGMQASRDGWLVRPLLHLEKAQLIAYGHECQVAYVEDSSNFKPDYRRNRYRHELLPVLKDIQPEAVRNMVAFMQMARQEEAFLTEMANRLLTENTRSRQADGIVFHLEPLSRLPDVMQLRVYKAAIKAVGGGAVGRRQLRRLQGMLLRREGCEELHLGGGLTCYRDYDLCELRRGRRQQRPPFQFVVGLANLPATVNATPVGGRIVLSKRNCFNSAAEGINLDLKRLHGKLVLRNWEPGDKIRLPWSGYHKKLKRYFIDYKISRDDRHKTVVVLDGDRIAAFINGPKIAGGSVVDRDYRITRDSSEVLNIVVESN